MNRNLRIALLALALPCALAMPTLDACVSSVGAPACNALANCCTNLDDPSSCTETAMSGELTDAECGQELDMYEQNGTCPVEGGVPAPGDAKAQ